MNRTLISFITLSFAFFLTTGCGGPARPAGMPKLYPASITVIQDGEPLAGALVLLSSEDPELVRWGPTGITDEQGVVVLRTDGKYNGAPLGTFKVVVEKRDRDPHPHPEWASLPPENPNYRRYDIMEMARKNYDLVELHYGSIVDTPLTVEITAKRKNYTVDVGKSVRILLKDTGAP